jgi:hypothetical protein
VVGALDDIGAVFDFKSKGKSNRFQKEPTDSALPTLIFESNSLMNKRQLIDDIRRLNTTVPPHFLAQFDESALKQYLDHLEGARKKHARIASWVRKTPRLRLVS